MHSGPSTIWSSSNSSLAIRSWSAMIWAIGSCKKSPEPCVDHVFDPHDSYGLSAPCGPRWAWATVQDCWAWVPARARSAHTCTRAGPAHALGRMRLCMHVSIRVDHATASHRHLVRCVVSSKLFLCVFSLYGLRLDCSWARWTSFVVLDLTTGSIWIEFWGVFLNITYLYMPCTKPNVAYALSIRFHADPEENHWKAVNSILEYLGSTKEAVS